MENKVTIAVMRSGLWRAAYWVLGVALGCYLQQAAAIKVERDSSVPPTGTPPKAAQPAPLPPPNLPKLTAAQIVDKNVVARGGLENWRALETMQLSGKMEAGGKQDTYLPYTLQIKRPNKQRLEIQFAGQTSVQVFDGKAGWKVRPYLNRANAEPFSPDELKKTEDGPGFDGPLIDYAAKGNKVELEGTEMVDGKATYRLKLTNKAGHAHHIWIDGTTFLETKVEDSPRRFDGKMRPVDTYYSDYRTVQGGRVVLPYQFETRVEGVHFNHKMTVEKVALNPKLDDAMFGKPPPAPLAPAKVFKTAPTTVGASSANANPPAAPADTAAQSK